MEPAVPSCNRGGINVSQRRRPFFQPRFRFMLFGGGGGGGVILGFGNLAVAVVAADELLLPLPLREEKSRLMEGDELEHKPMPESRE